MAVIALSMEDLKDAFIDYVKKHYPEVPVDETSDIGFVIDNANAKQLMVKQVHMPIRKTPKGAWN